jgi:hypothetical protein
MIACKRPRESPSAVPSLIEEVHQAVTTTQRARVLQKLSHISEGTFLVKAGIMRALCLQLGFVLNRPVMIESETYQISMVCSVISMLYQNCRDHERTESIADIGSELLRLLAKAWKRRIPHLQMLSIWRSFSACSTGALLLIHQAAFMPVMTEVLQHEATSKTSMDEALGVLKYVAHYAEDHRLSLLEQLGTLLSRLSCVLLTERSMERLSAIFRNLSLTPNVRLAMAEHSNVLTALVQLCSQGNQNCKTIRNVTCTLDNLSMETDSSMMLLLHGDGIILGVLLHLLTAAEDDVVRRRSARALRLLARDKAVPILLKSTNVMHSLHYAATHDPSCDVRSEATNAYAICAAKVNANMHIHAEVLNALTELAMGPAVTWVVLAFKEQVENPCNRMAVVENAELMARIVGAALQADASTLLKEHVSSALEILSEDEKIREKLVTELVLNVLVQNARDDDSATSRDAIRALLNLASTESTRKRLVTHRGLLQTLIRYSKACQDAGDKERVKNTILVLIPQI